MRTITRAVVGLVVAASFVAPSGSTMAAARPAAPNVAQRVNLQLTDLPKGFKSGVNGVEQHDDGTVERKAAAAASDADFYWKNAGGDRSVEVSTTVEYYRATSDAVKFLPAGILAIAKPQFAKMHEKVQACSIGEVCIYASGMIYVSPMGNVMFRHKGFVVSVFVTQTGKSLPVANVDTFTPVLARIIAKRIDGA